MYFKILPSRLIQPDTLSQSYETPVTPTPTHSPIPAHRTERDRWCLAVHHGRGSGFY